MPVYQIKRGSDVIVETYAKGTKTEELMNVTLAQLQFNLPYYQPFQFGDSVIIDGLTYKVNTQPVWNQISAQNFEYTLNLQAEHYDLNKVQLLGLDSENNPTQTEFSYTGTAIGLIDLIVLNINRLYPGWSRGTVDETSIETFDFSAATCRYGLTQLADKYGIEFWFDGKVINFTKQGEDTGLIFQRGMNHGLTQVGVESQDNVFATRWYIEGSKDNLIPGEYGHERLQLPAGQTYIEDSEKVALYGGTPIENTVFFDNIKPQRTAAVETVPTATSFTDSTIDFDINDARVSNDIDPKVVFKTGLLAGLEFTIQSYNNTTKTIVLNTNEDGYPNETVAIQIGDTYTLIDINMPASYIAAAEAELLAAGQDWYDANSDPKIKFRAPVDPIYLAENSVPVVLGNYVTVNVPEAGISRLIRIIKKTTDLEKPFNVTIELAEAAVIQSAVQQYIRMENVERGIGVVTDQAKTAAAQALNAKRTAEIVASVTSFLSTTIDGNVVATGTLIVGDAAGNNNAGITGVIEAGDPLDSVWLWGGDTYANRASAPFHVNQRGEMTATAGYIGGFEIGATSMQTAGAGTSDPRFVLYPDGSGGFVAFINPALGRWAGIGANVFPSSTGVAAVARFENTESNPVGTNYAMYAKASGGGTNIALSIGGGDIDFSNTSKVKRFSQKTVQSSSDLTVTDECVVVMYDTGTVTMPASPYIGRTVHVVKINSSDTVYAKSTDHQMRIRGGTISAGDTMVIPWGYSFVWDGQFWVVFAAQGE